MKCQSPRYDGHQCQRTATWGAFCHAHRVAYTVTPPPPFIPQGFLAPRWSDERREGAQRYNRVVMDAIEPEGVAFVSPAVEVVL